MAKAKNKKKDIEPKKNDEIMLAIRYGVTIPDKILSELFRLGCAEKIRKFSQDFKTVLDDMRRHGVGGAADLDYLSEFDNVFDVVCSVLDTVENTWGNMKKKITCKCKKGNVKNIKKPMANKIAKAIKTEKKQCLGQLSNEEMSKIRSLRKTGMPIKAIGKEIHRNEKIVSKFVHSIEAKGKK